MILKISTIDVSVFSAQLCSVFLKLQYPLFSEIRACIEQVYMYHVTVNMRLLHVFHIMFTHMTVISFPHMQVYISECVGVRWVGFSLTVFGIFSGLISLVTGRLYKYVPTSLLFYTSITISLAMSFFLIFWKRVPSLIVVFGLSVGWGWVDGACQTLGESEYNTNHTKLPSTVTFY